MVLAALVSTRSTFAFALLLAGGCARDARSPTTESPPASEASHQNPPLRDSIARSAGASGRVKRSVAAGADQAQVAGVQLKLSEQAGLCQLRALGGSEPQEMTLKIPWPCSFHRTDQGDVRVVVRAPYATLLVESSQPERDPQRAGDCDTYVQALRIRQSAVEASTVADRVASCPPFHWDEKMFTALF